MKHQPLFDDVTRRELRALVIANQVAPARADQVVDLACHAAERAVETVFQTCSTGPDVGVTMMATEIALQLAGDQMKRAASGLHSLADAMGVPQRGAHVTVGGGARG